MTNPLILQLGIPVLANILSQSLGGVDHPAAVNASKALGSFQDALLAGAMSNEQITEANRHMEAMTGLKTKHLESLMDEMHQSLRLEMASEDKYVRRMRPTFGYLMAATWAAQMFGLAYVMVFRTQDASLILNAVESLSMIWTVGLSVLGIYVYKRSEDKKLQSSSLSDVIQRAGNALGTVVKKDDSSQNNDSDLIRNLNS